MSPSASSPSVAQDRPAEHTALQDSALQNSVPWQRLDKRMLLIYPVREAMRFLPILLLSVVIGTAAGSYKGLLVFALVLPIAAARYWVTQYRVGPIHVQMRQGLWRRQTTSVPLARVRSVEVESDALHRILRLSVLRIGTSHRSSTSNKPGNGFLLDGLDRAHVQELRIAVLATAHGRAIESEADAATSAGRTAEIGRWSPSWARYAPFSLLGMVTFAAVAGAAPPAIRGLATPKVLDAAYHWLAAASGLKIMGLIALAVIAIIASSSVLAVFGYLTAFARYRLVDTGPVLDVDFGLIKHTQRSYNRGRLRGGSLKEPLFLRLVGGAKADAIMTGIHSRRVGGTILLPQSPVAETRRVLNQVLPTLDTEITLLRHGRHATLRRFTHALWPVAAVAAAQLLAQLAVPGWPAWPWAVVAGAAVFMALVALDRARSLGHATPEGWLVTRSGSLNRSQDHLAAEGIIGWTVRQSYFQRRDEIADLIAATPAGRGKYVVKDVSIDRAWTVIEQLTPGIACPLLERPAESESIMES